MPPKCPSREAVALAYKQRTPVSYCQTSCYRRTVLSKLLTWTQTCRARDAPGLHPLVVLLARRPPLALSCSMAVVMPRQMPHRPVPRRIPHRPVPRRVPSVIRRRLAHAAGRLISRGRRWVPRATNRCRLSPSVCFYEFEQCCAISTFYECIFRLYM